MADLNIYYNKQTNTWWLNKEMDGFSLQKYIQENPVGLGTVEFTSKKDMEKTKLHRIESAFIPDYIKTITVLLKK